MLYIKSGCIKIRDILNNTIVNEEWLHDNSIKNMNNKTVHDLLMDQMELFMNKLNKDMD